MHDILKIVIDFLASGQAAEARFILENITEYHPKMYKNKEYELFELEGYKGRKNKTDPDDLLA